MSGAQGKVTHETEHIPANRCLEWNRSPILMSDTTLTVNSIQQCLDRLATGDETAREHLLCCACDRLTRLTRKMLRGFPRVRRWEETDDVFQNALLRLCNTLRLIQPKSPTDFFRLAAVHIRRELIDLSRKHYGPEGWGRNTASHRSKSASRGTHHQNLDSPETTLEPGKLALWTEFHEQIALLPPEDCEMFDLLWYQGRAQAEAAMLLGVSERTIQRRWQSARVHLNSRLKGSPPDRQS
jgi:RNA polymerase sigma factor (sigma-70 family)